MVYKAFKIITFLFLTSIILSTCCEDDYNIQGIDFYGAYYWDEKKVYPQTDTITEQLIFEITIDYYGYLSSNLNLINSCYAISCNEIYNQTIDLTSIKLYTDKPIQILNEIVEPFSDLISNSTTKKYIEIDQIYDKRIIIIFDENFNNEAKDMIGEFTFYMDCFSTDSTTFKDSINLYLDIQ